MEGSDFQEVKKRLQSLVDQQLTATASTVGHERIFFPVLG